MKVKEVLNKLNLNGVYVRLRIEENQNPYRDIYAFSAGTYDKANSILIRSQNLLDKEVSKVKYMDIGKKSKYYTIFFVH